MSCPWAAHGLPMACLGHGMPMGCPGTGHGQVSIDCPWILCGLPISCPWAAHRMPMGCP